jgi:hypothetical protein
MIWELYSHTDERESERVTEGHLDKRGSLAPGREILIFGILHQP